MLEELPRARGAVTVWADREDALRRLDRLGVAEGAPAGRLRRRRAVASLRDVRCGREHLRYHVAGAQHDHLLARANVLAQQVLLVVQRRQLDRHAAHGDRREHGIGAQVAELAHVPHDLLEPRHGRGGRELPRHRPARLAPHGAEAPLQLEV